MEFPFLEFVVYDLKLYLTCLSIIAQQILKLSPAARFASNPQYPKGHTVPKGHAISSL